MPCNYLCPSPGGLEQILQAIIGEPVAVAIDKNDRVDPDAPALLGEFVSDEDTVGALCLVDHTAALTLGGVLAGVPTDATLQAIEGYKLDDSAIENVREVVNVLAQLFNSDFTPHLRFRELHRQPGKLPEAMTEFRRKPMAKRNFKVTVEKYATGHVSFLLG